MYDDLMKEEEDNPTIGVLLCTDTDDTIAKYSVLHGNEQLFAAKYMAYMPTEEELARVIEQQKRFFLEQHGMEEWLKYVNYWYKKHPVTACFEWETAVTGCCHVDISDGLPDFSW